MRGMKEVYVFENINGVYLSPMFQKRNDALTWERNNKINLKEKPFLMKRVISKKYYDKYFRK